MHRQRLPALWSWFQGIIWMCCRAIGSPSLPWSYVLPYGCWRFVIIGTCLLFQVIIEGMFKAGIVMTALYCRKYILCPERMNIVFLKMPVNISILFWGNGCCVLLWRAGVWIVLNSQHSTPRGVVLVRICHPGFVGGYSNSGPSGVTSLWSQQA